MSSQFDVITVGSLFVEITPTTPGVALDAAHDYTLVAGGAAANTVFALARLGVNTGFVTAVGDDPFGTLVTRELRAFGVDTCFIRRAHGQLTPASFCAIDQQGGKQFSFYRFPGYCAPMETLTANDFSGAADCRLFDFSEGSIREPHLRSLVFEAARLAGNNAVPVLYSVNLRKSAWNLPDEDIIAVQREAIRLADILVCNEEEMHFLTGMPFEEGLQQLQMLGPRVLVMTRGGDGDIAVRMDDTTGIAPIYRVPVVYDIGAGDTFHAGLVAALRREFTSMTLGDWQDAASFAAAAAAIRVSTSADPHDLPTYEYVRQWMEHA